MKMKVVIPDSIQHGEGVTTKYYREKTGQVGEGSCSSYTSQHGTD